MLGLLYLRVREPNLKRPYKVRSALRPPDVPTPHRLSHPLTGRLAPRDRAQTFLATPVLFASTALFLLVLSCFSKPWESLAAFAFCVAGAVPYYIQKRRKDGQLSRPSCASLRLELTRLLALTVAKDVGLEMS